MMTRHQDDNQSTVRRQLSSCHCPERLIIIIFAKYTTYSANIDIVPVMLLQNKCSTAGFPYCLRQSEVGSLLPGCLVTLHFRTSISLFFLAVVGYHPSLALCHCVPIAWTLMRNEVHSFSQANMLTFSIAIIILGINAHLVCDVK